jgi:hypothetical protein
MTALDLELPYGLAGDGRISAAEDAAPTGGGIEEGNDDA